MSEQHQRLTMAGSAGYRICVQGAIEQSWFDVFNGMVVNRLDTSRENALTVLTGDLRDQAELLGMLNRLYGLGLPLISVQWLGLEQPGRISHRSPRHLNQLGRRYKRWRRLHGAR